MAVRDEILGVFRFFGLPDPDPARLDIIAAQVESGDRNLLDVRNDLMQFMADEAGVSLEEFVSEQVRGIFEQEGAAIATGEETEEERIARIVQEVLAGSEGDVDTGRTFADIRAGIRGDTGDEDQPPTVDIQGVTLPSDVTGLLRVNGEGGIADEYYVQGQLYGQTFSFLIGGQAEFDAMFPQGIDGFSSFTTMSRNEFTQSDLFGFVSGTIDEIQGTTEPLAAQLLRDLESLGLESLPDWMRNDQQAMLLLVQANNEGWSAGRLSDALVDTAGFQSRYVGFSDWYDRDEHGSVGEAIGQWVSLENQFRAALRGTRGPDTDTSVEYVGSLIASGWGVTEFTSLLEGERQLLSNPLAMENLNEILASSGQQQLTPDEMVDFIMQGDQFAGFELINDALRGAALAEQGIDLTGEQLALLGTGSALGIATPGAFTEQAHQAAVMIAANLSEIERGKLGVTEEQVLALLFQDRDLLPEGQTLAQTELLFQQLGRERASLARGTGGPTAFQDERGRLRIPGLGG